MRTCAGTSGYEMARTVSNERKLHLPGFARLFSGLSFALASGVEAAMLHPLSGGDSRISFAETS